MIRVTLNADHKYFYVKVADSGVGIPEDCQDQVFDRFIAWIKQDQEILEAQDLD
mgnify:FL=1